MRPIRCFRTNPNGRNTISSAATLSKEAVAVLAAASRVRDSADKVLISEKASKIFFPIFSVALLVEEEEAGTCERLEATFRWMWRLLSRRWFQALIVILNCINVFCAMFA